jgi:GntR family transcriptional regulator
VLVQERLQRAARPVIFMAGSPGRAPGLPQRGPPPGGLLGVERRVLGHDGRDPLRVLQGEAEADRRPEVHDVRREGADAELVQELVGDSACPDPSSLVHYSSNEPLNREVPVPSLDEGTPLFVQIAEQLADDIVDGTLAEGARVPSTNELAAFYRINPATAAKGLNLLVDDAVLEKRRGIGMFVAGGAQEQLRAGRRKQFAEQYLDPMLAEASRLGIDRDTLMSLIRGFGWHNGGDTP